MNNENVYHIWPDNTWCRAENLEEYLKFMSDDYVSVVVPYKFDEDGMPTYSDAVVMYLSGLWGRKE